MLHMKMVEFDKLDRGSATAVVLGMLVAAMGAAIFVLLYLPLR